MGGWSTFNPTRPEEGGWGVALRMATVKDLQSQFGGHTSWWIKVRKRLFGDGVIAKVGRKYFFDAADVERWIRNGGRVNAQRTT